ncbi:MAG: insulinase family protein [Clostridiales bacterium]|nr:insulinase family protein [Clostridiales bacterium]
MYKRYELSNGIQVITEKIPHFRSVSIGLWFRVGSVYENSSQNGLSHFIEHMLFKGTTSRSAKDIANALDAVGGQLNAFTAKECSCFYAKVIDEHLELALELLSDMVLNSTFNNGELEKEKGVILEEIAMYEDSPDDVVHELLSSKFFGSHPLGRPILGIAKNIKEYTQNGILKYYDLFYSPGNLVISIAGNFNRQDLIKLLEKYFGGWYKPGHEYIQLQFASPHNGISYKYKDIEQAHMAIGYPGVSLGDDDIYPLMVFNNIFGGGMSSRLFQRIREDNGLAYSVFSFPSSYKHGGLFTIYAGMKSEQTERVASLIADEIDSIKDTGITNNEFSMAREQLKGNYILGLESTGSRMTAIGKNQLLLGKVLSPDEIMQKIDNVTLDSVYQAVNRVFSKGYKTIAFVSREDLTVNIQDIL